MPRGLVIFLIVVGVLGGAAYLGLPALKRAFIGESLMVHAIVTSATEEEVEYHGDVVTNTILDMEISFPLGGAPEKAEDLEVLDDKDRPLDIGWPSAPQKEDDYDENITRWTLREVFFPAGFRQGRLRCHGRDLCYIRVQKVPFP